MYILINEFVIDDWNIDPLCLIISNNFRLSLKYDFKFTCYEFKSIEYRLSMILNLHVTNLKVITSKRWIKNENNICKSM